MNEMRLRDPASAEAARLTALIGQQPLPEFVSGFVLRFGEFEGDPAVWVTFKTREDLPEGEANAAGWIEQANALVSHLRALILDSGGESFPFFRFEVDARENSGSL